MISAKRPRRIQRPLQAACRELLGDCYPEAGGGEAGPGPAAPTLRPLAVAIAALSIGLGGLGGNAEAAQWSYEAAALLYDENDRRVSAVEPVFSAHADFGDQRYLNLKLAVDVLTGASPNAVPPSASSQTFTSPSQLSEYRVEPGQLPLDDAFRDTRVAFSGNWDAPLGERYRGVFGWSASTEFDYLSIGGNAALSRGFNRNNTTLSFGGAFSLDSVEPVGGKPYELGYAYNVGGRLEERDAAAAASNPRGGFEDDGAASRDGNSDSKTVLDLLIGLSQVINENTLLRVNYGATLSDGYLSDPYKLLAVIYPESGPEAGNAPCRGAWEVARIEGLMPGDPVAYCNEQRPDSRLQQNLYTEIRRYFSGNVLNLGYRLSVSDWGVNAHTLDARWRWQMGQRWYLRPHLRYYRQSAADFYRSQLVYGDPLPAEVSADPRLSQMTGLTYGLELGQGRAGGAFRWSIAAELYSQSFEPSDTPIGNQQGIDRVPDVDAVMLRWHMGFGT